MSKRKRENFICPDCNGKSKMSDDIKCELCGGTGVFSDVDTEEKFLGRYDFNE